MCIFNSQRQKKPLKPDLLKTSTVSDYLKSSFVQIPMVSPKYMLVNSESTFKLPTKKSGC